MNPETIAAVVEALSHMDEGWGHLNCDEADAFARLLAENGDARTAATMIEIFHAPADEDPTQVTTDDRHFGLQGDAALAYVNGLTVG